MIVPYLDLAAAHRSLEDELLEATRAVLRHGQFILGPEVAAFESQLAELVGTRFAIGVNSGTDALLLALRVLGIQPGDEVITAPNSFVATASAIIAVGARPVFADVGPNFNLDPARVEAAITPRTRALIPVHLTGRPADMEALGEIAQRHRLYVIEDAAQAIQARFNGRNVGALSDIGCFSMHPLKNLAACGDAGAITTNDERLYRRLMWLRNIGLVTREQAVEWSGNSRLDTLQAAMLTVKFKYLTTWTEKRRANADYYREALSTISQIELPCCDPREYAVYHTFVIQAERRDALKTYLADKGVGTAIHYPIPIHLQQAATTLGHKPGDFPVAERQASRIISLPIYPDLNSEQRAYVVDCIREFYARGL